MKEATMEVVCQRCAGLDVHNAIELNAGAGLQSF